jgi:hypothetical protein
MNITNSRTDLCTYSSGISVAYTYISSIIMQKVG